MALLIWILACAFGFVVIVRLHRLQGREGATLTAAWRNDQGYDKDGDRLWK